MLHWFLMPCCFLGLQFLSLRVATPYIVASQRKFLRRLSMWIDKPLRSWVGTKRLYFLLTMPEKNNQEQGHILDEEESMRGTRNVIHTLKKKNDMLEESMRGMTKVCSQLSTNLLLKMKLAIAGSKPFPMSCSSMKWLKISCILSSYCCE